MNTYISLGKWTQKGIENVKDSPKRLDKVKAATKAAGAKMKDFYMTMGQYDFVTIIEAPDAETVAKVLLSIGVQGAVQTTTMPAFTEKEYRTIVSSLP